MDDTFENHDPIGKDYVDYIKVMIVGQKIHWLSTEEENTCPVFEEKSHKNKVRECLPKLGAIYLSAVIKLCVMFSY